MSKAPPVVVPMVIWILCPVISTPWARDAMPAPSHAPNATRQRKNARQALYQPFVACDFMFPPNPRSTFRKRQDRSIFLDHCRHLVLADAVDRRKLVAP